MAHLKRANAMVVHPRITGRGWGGICKQASIAPKKDLSAQTREILGSDFDAEKYLFTHCTIVASVDVDKVPDISLGKVKVGSTTVDRRYDDYYIKPECSQYVNNNGDSWSRQVLLAAYPTFVGAHNFQEHVQIEAQSKGRIIDAVARDVGDSIYIDILVATDRKHSTLVKDIEDGRLSTLSMGCTTDFTICSQCGHFAVDETDLCEHIGYNKLNTFIDEKGKKRVVAELCGHVSYQENSKAPGGVRFIEASWVEVPAFTGAVMRNILTASEVKVPESEIRRILFSSFAPNWSDTAISKAASLASPPSSKVGFDFGGSEAPPAEGAEAPPEEEKKKPLVDLENSVYDMISKRVQERFKQELESKPQEGSNKLSTWPNDTLNREGSLKTPEQYKASLVAATRTASTRKELVSSVAKINQAYSVEAHPALYRVALSVGSPRRYGDKKAYARNCFRAAGRDLSPAELRVVIRVGTLLSLWESCHNSPLQNPERSP